MKITLLILCKAKAFRLRVWVKNWISKYNFGIRSLRRSHMKKWCDELVYKATKLQMESLLGAERWIRDLNQNKKILHCAFPYYSVAGGTKSRCAWLCMWDVPCRKRGWSHPERVSVVFSLLDAACGHFICISQSVTQWVKHHLRSHSHFLPNKSLDLLSRIDLWAKLVLLDCRDPLMYCVCMWAVLLFRKHIEKRKINYILRAYLPIKDLLVIYQQRIYRNRWSWDFLFLNLRY